MKDKGQIIVFSIIAFILFAVLAVTGKGQGRFRAHPGKVEINLPVPPAWQFIDRILRPCSSGATPFVSATAGSSGNLELVTCVGKSVTINGTPITPGAGLPDPGSNGFVVRTALNTDVARTLTVTTPITITNGSGVAGNPLIACPTCVTSAASLTSTALMTGAGLQASQTPAATATLAANGNISTPGSVTTGNAGGVTGAIDLNGSTSGTVTTTVKAAAGTWTLTLPDNDGNSGEFLQTNGSGVTTWAAAGGGVTCAGCTTNTLTKYNGTNLANSRIIDNGTDIDANSGAGIFQAGDTGFNFNGSFLSINDGSGVINMQANANGANNSTLSLQQGAGLLTSSQGATTVTITASAATNLVDITAPIVQPHANGTTDLGTTSLGYKQLFIDSTITAGGTTGNQTINKAAGSVNFAAAATSLTVTSNKVTASSVVLCTVATNDATLKSVQCVAGSGSFVMFASAAATAETRVNFWILNQ